MGRKSIMSMRRVTKKDIDWVVKASFGRHADVESMKNRLPLKSIAKVLITVWEAGEAPNRLTRAEKKLKFIGG
jgi:hypothetical protein